MHISKVDKDLMKRRDKSMPFRETAWGSLGTFMAL